MNDNDQTEAIFDEYRQFRNTIRKYPLEDTLAVCRAYSQNMANNVPFADDLEVFPQYKDLANGIKQWEIEIMAREAVANSPRYIATGKTLRKSSNFIDLMNKLRRLENKISSLVVNTGNVLTELHRIGHRQFEWQSDIPNSTFVLRYYKIFTDPAMARIVEDEIGLSTHKVYLCGMSMTGVFLKWFALNYPPTILMSKSYNLTVPELDKFMSHFSIKLEASTNLLGQEIKDNMNENYTYFWDALRTYPIIEMPVENKRSFVAPLPTLLTWRFTRGLYYELYSHSGFDKAFGYSFQNYAGEVLNNLFASNEYTILPEEPTANNRGVSSSDWFLINKKSALYVEAKTKRMGLAAKIALSDTAKLTSELGKLADAVIQVYKCIQAVNHDNLSGQQYKSLKNKAPYPIVVTLESWHIFGPTWTKLNELVKERLVKAILPEEWIETIPFIVCDINEFEILCQAIEAADSIDDILAERNTDKDLMMQEIYTYLFNKHKKELLASKQLFQGEFDKLFT
jgi:hypothetical protein